MKRFSIIHWILIFEFILFNYSNSFPQDIIRIDSITQAIKRTDNDSLKSDLYQKLFWEYRRSNTDKAYECAEISLQLSKSVGYSVGIAYSLLNIGIIKKVKNQYNEAAEFLKEAGNYYKSMNDTIGIVECLTNLADICNKQNDFEKALEYLYEARNLVVVTPNVEKLSRIYSMLGGIYTSQKQFGKALEYHRKSLDINTKQGFTLGISVNYNNIGNVYYELKDYSSAKESYLKALEIKMVIKDIIGIANTYNNLGLVSKEQGKVSEAQDYHEKSLTTFIELDDKSGIAISYTNLASDYLAEGNPNQAIRMAMKGLEITNKYHLNRIQTETYQVLSNGYAKLGRFDKAYHYQKLYEKYHDSISSLEVTQKITEMESRFEAAKKEKEIALLSANMEKQDLKIKQQKAQWNLMAGLIILVFAVLIFLYLGYRNKRRLNVRLREINETKSRFFANISHEFRTPLTLLLGPLEKLLNNPKQEEKEMIQIMHRNASRLLMLDNQLLDLSRLESGKLRLKVMESEIIHALRGMVMSFQSIAEKRNIHFDVRIPQKELKLYYDQDKLEKIVFNLLSNAMKFTPENGNVIFELQKIEEKTPKSLPSRLKKLPGQVICISVADSGPGIAKEHLPLIFDRFYQIDSRWNRQFEGSGIGLSLTKELVELHHGIIDVESTPGKGSTFRIYLPTERKAYSNDEIDENSFQQENAETLTPYHEPGSKESKEKLEQVSANSGDDKYLVLIVEDNADMRNYIRDCFDNRHEIIEAPEGWSGFEKAAGLLPDIIISDLMMPGMDGIELCKKLKGDERTSHIPVILLTALASNEDRVKGLETGADDYIAKPFSREELRVRTLNLIDQRKKLIERFSKSVRIEPKDITVSSIDEIFIKKLISKIEKHLSDPDLSVDYLMEEIHLSRSQLHRKLKTLTGLSATEFIRTIRLKRAAQLLKQHHGTVTEIVYAVGFNSISYFSRCFQKQFGITPREYTDQNSSGS